MAGGWLLLGPFPASVPRLDRAVMGTAHPAEETGVHAVAEAFDLLTPLVGAVEVAHTLARRHHQAAGPRRRCEVLVLAGERGGCGLVEAPQTLGDLAPFDVDRAFSGDREHLEVALAVAVTQVARLLRSRPGAVQTSASQRVVCLEDGQPPVLGSGLQLLEDPRGAREPATRNGFLPAEFEVIVPEPQRHPGRRPSLALLAVAVIGAHPSVEAALDVIQPPRGPAQALQRRGALTNAECAEEPGPRFGPGTT
jgi:hypothetical protein